jgi:hypothetical protein
MHRPKQLEAGPFAADVASFRLHLAAENKAAGTVRTYTKAIRSRAGRSRITLSDRVPVHGHRAGIRLMEPHMVGWAGVYGAREWAICVVCGTGGAAHAPRAVGQCSRALAQFDGYVGRLAKCVVHCAV